MSDFFKDAFKFYADWEAFRAKFRKPLQMRTCTSCSSKGVAIQRSNGVIEFIGWNEIKRISVVVTCEGNSICDFYLCLSIDSKAGCLIPVEAAGFSEVYNVVSRFEGFDNMKYAAAKLCRENAEFACWEKA